jgi:hypothetical protein|nr:MAG TPA: hypothetical protein [Caudoviricetes sp.]
MSFTVELTLIIASIATIDIAEFSNSKKMKMFLRGLIDG